MRDDEDRTDEATVRLGSQVPGRCGTFGPSTLAIAPMLSEAGFRDEAADLVAEAVKPPLIDPLQSYWTGDPEELARLNDELRRALRR